MIKEKIILASQSVSRAKLLKAAGFDNLLQISSNIDEGKIKKNFNGEVEELAIELAVKKAQKISSSNKNEWVIGADQILVFEDKIYDKSVSVEAARKLFHQMRNKSHFLIGGFVIVKNCEIQWRHSSKIKLTLRDFSDEMLESYIARMGDEILSAVGGYKLEGEAVQFFEKIDGDYFTILGLDLLELLKGLRKLGAISK